MSCHGFSSSPQAGKTWQMTQKQTAALNDSLGRKVPSGRLVHPTDRTDVHGLKSSTASFAFFAHSHREQPGICGHGSVGRKSDRP